MGRRPKVEVDRRQRMCLRTIASHPWARVGFLQALSGLTGNEFRHAVERALAAGHVERAAIPLLRRSPRRYGLTPGGAAECGLSFDRPWHRHVFLQSLRLDLARAWLQRQLKTGGIVWAMSPYRLPAEAIRPATRPESLARSAMSGDWAYRSLRLDLLACLQFGARRYLTVAVMIDLGDIKLDWLFHQFRSAQAWQRRPEYQRAGAAFPVFVVITPERRWGDVVQLWRDSVSRHAVPPPLRLVCSTQLDGELAWTEGAQRVALWAGVWPAEQPSHPPAGPEAGWYAAPAADDAAAISYGQPHDPGKRRAGLLEWAAHTNSAMARLVHHHQTIRLRARQLLDRVGQYPLIRADELAVVVGCGEQNVRDGLRELRQRGLVQPAGPAERGVVLTEAGLRLLAAQMGHPPAEYAALRRWPMHQEAGRSQYSVQTWLALREHTRLLLDFLVGLRRHGPAARLHLAYWDHVQCAQLAPPGAAQSSAALEPVFARVIPDASGVVHCFDATLSRQVEFWLEVDRGTIGGRALTQKLARYCQPGRGRRPRLLVLVETDAEARLQRLRRRLVALTQKHRADLDVRFTRVDLLRDDQGRLDPTKRAWRTLQGSDFVLAFGVEL